MNVKRYLLIAVALLIADWVMGALQAAHVVPPWSFLVLNFPFGLPFVWLESHWTGTQYAHGGAVSINEAWSFIAFFFAVLAQAWLYAAGVGYWRSRRRQTPGASLNSES